MPERKAMELLRKHNIDPTEVQERRATLHHLRRLVREEELPFDVFREIVRLRR
jgi:arsenate reductase-like glutaredoxin family protein